LLEGGSVGSLLGTLDGLFDEATDGKLLGLSLGIVLSDGASEGSIVSTAVYSKQYLHAFGHRSLISISPSCTVSQNFLILFFLPPNQPHFLSLLFFLFGCHLKFLSFSQHTPHVWGQAALTSVLLQSRTRRTSFLAIQ